MLTTEQIKSIHCNSTDTTFTISWQMTHWCNYRCPYCTMSKAASHASYIPESILLARAQKLAKFVSTLESHKRVKLNLIGGEVTYYNLPRILLQFDLTKIHRVTLTTNFSQDLDYFYKLAESVQGIKVSLLLSYHEQFGTFKDFYQKALTLSQNTDMEVRIAYVISNLVNIETIKQVYDGKLKFIPQPMRLRGTGAVVELDEAHRQFVESLLHKESDVNSEYRVTLTDGTVLHYPSKRALHNDIKSPFTPYGLKCSCGRTCIRVLPSGLVGKGTCLFAQREVICNLDTDEDIPILTDDVVCGQTRACSLCNEVNIYRGDYEES